MNFYYNGTDIYNDVSVNYCVHEMFAEKQADTLVIRFNDTKGIWSKWQPAAGDTVRFKEGASDTGKMFIHSMKPENGLFTIRAMSMPKTAKIRKSKSCIRSMGSPISLQSQDCICHFSEQDSISSCEKRAVPIHLVAQAGFWHFHCTCFS